MKYGYEHYRTGQFTPLKCTAKFLLSLWKEQCQLIDDIVSIGINKSIACSSELDVKIYFSSFMQ